MTIPSSRQRSRALRLLSVTIAAFTVLFYLSASIVYACSGLSHLSKSTQTPSDPTRTVERGPCHDDKANFCESVRTQLLSPRTSPPQLTESGKVIQSTPALMGSSLPVLNQLRYFTLPSVNVFPQAWQELRLYLAFSILRI